MRRRGRVVIVRGFLFRENVLWDLIFGYVFNFGKGISLLVIFGEFLWLINYFFWKEISWDLLK